MPEKDRQFFTSDFRREYGAVMLEAFRQGAKGVTRDYTIERIDWPFQLEEIRATTVLAFLGEEDTAVDPRVGACDEITVAT